MNKVSRSALCGTVTPELNDQNVSLCGWVQRRRDHGGVIFIDLRDRSGMVQVVMDPDRQSQFAIAEAVRNEYVLWVSGRIRPRPEGTENPELPTGAIELLGHDIEILNASLNNITQLFRQERNFRLTILGSINRHQSTQVPKLVLNKLLEN